MEPLNQQFQINHNNILSSLGNLWNGVKGKIDSYFHPAFSNLETPEQKFLDRTTSKPEIANSIYKAFQETGVSPVMMRSILDVENSPMDSAAKAKDTGDIGLFQHHSNTIPQINKLFNDKYGRDYNPLNPEDSAIGTGLYIGWLKQRPLVKNDKDVVIAYNLGPGGLVDFKRGVRKAVLNGNNYWNKYSLSEKNFEEFNK